MSWMQTRQTKYSAYVTVYVLVVLAILGAVNWLAQRHNKSFDATQNKRFSLADQTTKVVRDLKDDVKIMHFDSPGSRSFQSAKDLLERYDVLSTKLTVEYVDPNKKPTVAKLYGVRNEGTTFVESKGKREEARSVSEEEITSAIIRTMKTGDRNICAVAGSGEHELEDTQRDGLSGLKALIEKNNYKTRTIKLVEKAEVPKDCTVLLVAGPRFDYQQPAVDAIKAYLTGGGRLLAALDPPIQLGKETVSENKALADFLAGVGFVLNNNLVYDTSGVGQLFGLSEVVPLVTSYEQHIIVREMKSTATAFPLARSLEIKAAGNVNPEKLFSTTQNSFATSNLTSLKLDPNKDKQGPHLLGAATIINSGASEATKGRVVVVGSSGFLSNGILRFNGNSDLAMNMMNWLSADEELISIRPKDPQDRRLSLTRNQMRFVMYASVVLLPLMMIAAGVGVWWRRR
ncbi:MAG: GldG family protein [Bryobacterales bacterium]|nr:GldG family protein [Bryobacterales bacterium]